MGIRFLPLGSAAQGVWPPRTLCRPARGGDLVVTWPSYTSIFDRSASTAVDLESTVCIPEALGELPAFEACFMHSTSPSAPHCTNRLIPVKVLKRSFPRFTPSSS